MFFSSTLLLTLLLAIGLVFFLRAASKDRTTVIELHSSRPPIEVLDGISNWLEERGWRRSGGDADSQILRFSGRVLSSGSLAILLSIFGGLGSSCLGLVLRQLYPSLGWWPLLLVGLGPVAGLFYQRSAMRIEDLEMRLVSNSDAQGSVLRVKAHRDELIAIELELSTCLDLKSDGSLLSSPI